MPVNRYDEAVVTPYIEQYTPIPFDTLYRLGQVYNTQRDATEKAFQTALQQYREFTSPSAIDTQRWQDLTVKPATQLAEEMASNPEMLRTPEGRRRIQNFINTRPYAQLSMLQQNKELFEKRQELEQKLSLAGKYNYDWHNFDYANYDTLGGNGRPGRGLLSSSDLNLVPYMSVQELVKPYTDQVNESLLDSDGMYDYYGRSKQALRGQVDANKSEILNTPAARMHIEAMVRRGATPQAAMQSFMEQVYTAAEERASLRREANPYALKSARSGSGSGSEPTGPITTRTDEIFYDNRANYTNLLSSTIKQEEFTDKDGKKSKRYVIDSPVFDFAKSQGADDMLAQNEAAMFEGMKQVFSGQTEFLNKDGSIPNDIIKRVSDAIKAERGNEKDKTTRVHTGSKYFSLVNKMYDRGVESLMMDNTAYNSADMDLLFGDDVENRSLEGLSVLTPKQYVLATSPHIRNFVESQGLSTESVQADAPFYAPLTADRDYDIEEHIAKDPANAKPVRINGVMIVNTPQGPQAMFKVTVKYPIDKLGNAPGWFVTSKKVLKDGGYTIDKDDNVTTDILVAAPYNDQLRRRIDMNSEELAGSSTSEKAVRQQHSNDQHMIGREHRIAGQY